VLRFTRPHVFTVNVVIGLSQKRRNIDNVVTADDMKYDVAFESLLFQ